MDDFWCNSHNSDDEEIEIIDDSTNDYDCVDDRMDYNDMDEEIHDLANINDQDDDLEYNDREDCDNDVGLELNNDQDDNDHGDCDNDVDLEFNNDTDLDNDHEDCDDDVDLEYNDHEDCDDVDLEFNNYENHDRDYNDDFNTSEYTYFQAENSSEFPIDLDVMQDLYSDSEEQESDSNDEAKDPSSEDAQSTFSPRAYQLELFEHAKSKNSILVLGTGTGKTFISILLIKEFAESIRGRLKDGAKRTVFLVNTVPLVHQQAKAIAQHTGFKVGLYEGSMGVDIWSPEKWVDELNENEVLVMVAQIFLDLILAARICFTNINLIIMDECHHATGFHPMREIMREYNEVKKVNVELPRIMGLTACIIQKRVEESKVVGLMRELESVMDSVLVTSKDLDTVRKFGTKAELVIVKCKAVQQPPTFDHVKTELATILKGLEEKIVNEKHLKSNHKSKVQKLVKRQINGILDITKDLGDYILVKAIKLQSEYLQLAEADNIYEKQLLTEMGEMLDNLHKKCDFSHIIDPRSYLSSKVLRLLEVLGDCSEETRTLVFVTRRNTAKLLTSILLDLKSLDKSLDFLLPESVVGGAFSSKFDIKVAQEEIKKQKETIDRFRKGDCNLIVSTSVLEEGIDIRKCNLVIRYNEPNNYRSYIQSLGRARAVPSYFITLCPEEDTAQLMKSYMCFRRIDDHLNSLCHDRELPTDREIQNHFEKDELEPPFAPLGIPGPHVTFNSAIQLINRYCGTLPQDKFTNLQVNVDKKRTKDGKFIVHLTLPINAPYRKSVCGNPMSNWDDAKKSAALNMCRTLYDLNLFDASLLPKKLKAEAEEGLKKYLKVFEEVPKGNPQPGTMKRRQVYQRRICKAFKGESRDFSLYRIYFQHLEARENGLIIDSDHKVTQVGFLCRSRLNVCSFPLYSDKWGEVNIILEYVKDVSSDWDVMKRVKQFHNVASQMILNLNMKVLHFNPGDNRIYIVPLTKDKGIDTSLLKDFKNPLDSQILKNFKYGKRETRNGSMASKIDAHKYENGVIFPLYRELEMFYVDNVMYDESPLSSFPVKKKQYASYKDYVKQEYNADISTDDQPMLECKHFSKEFNYLGKKKVTKTKQSMHPKFIPELCFLLPCTATFWAQLLCVASILFRINGLEIEQELYLMIRFPRTQEVEDKKKFSNSPLNYSWLDEAINRILWKKPAKNNLCIELSKKRDMVIYPGMFLQALTPLNIREDFNLERLELLGDSYLKFIVGLYLFCLEYASNEGLLTIQRSRIVSNKSLYLLAKDKGIAEMYQGVLLRSGTAVPFGFEVSAELEDRLKEQKVPAEEWQSFSSETTQPPATPSSTSAAAKSKSAPSRTASSDGAETKIAARSRRKSKHPDSVSSADRVHNPWTEQFLADKCVADSVEALIGSCLVAGGEEAAKHFMKWIGFDFLNEKTSLPRSGVTAPDLSAHQVTSSLQSMYKRHCLDRLERKMNYVFRDKSFLVQAVTHPSFLSNKVTDCYQRLEFLGDAILDYLIAGHIFTQHRDYSPGQLTDLKSHYVKNETLAKICVKFEFHKYLLHMSSKLDGSTSVFINMLEDGEKEFNTETDTVEAEDVDIPKALGDIVEALIGAVYVDSGHSLEATWALIELLLRDEFEATKTDIPIDSVRELYEKNPRVKIHLVAPTEDEKAKCIVKMPGCPELTGIGKNKRTAKQAAAKLALGYLENNPLKT